VARSINQNAYSGALPNFRNLGIMLRILLMGNAAALAAAVVKGSDMLGAWREFVESAALVEPLLVLSVLALAALSASFPTGSARLRYWRWSWCSRGCCISRGDRSSARRRRRSSATSCSLR
jgi:two-component system sensor histidine kinase AlgZ